MSIPNMSLKQSATSGANGDNMLSQTSRFGDYIVGAPSWLKSKDGVNGGGLLNQNTMLIGALVIAGAVLWKLKK